MNILRGYKKDDEDCKYNEPILDNFEHSSKCYALAAGTNAYVNLEKSAVLQEVGELRLC